jgi:Ca-activated chloride channel family protein
MLPLAAISTLFSTKLNAVLRTFARLLIAILCALTMGVPVSAQAPTGADEIVKVDTRLLVYPIRVRDKRGGATNVLSDRDLTLKDSDHLVSGLYLYAGVDSLSLMFALDQSGSLRNIIAQQRTAAIGLIDRFGERSQVAVIRFAERPFLAVPFNRDPSVAAAAFAFPVKPNQHTAIFDAAGAAVNAFAALPKRQSERRIVILISDGLDNASAAKPDAIIKAAFERQISFYVIHLPLFAPRDGRLAVRPASKGFRELAEKTGGKYFLAGDAKSALAGDGAVIDLAPIFRAIEDDLRSQYLLGWYLGEGAKDGRTHRFSISMPHGVEYQLGNFKFSRTHEFSYQPDPNATSK